MRWSKAFIPTLRDDPSGAEAVSHRLLLRAGYIRQLGSGIYSLLPLAQRVRRKIIGVIREELEGIGAQEFVLPALHPDEIWKESGRWDLMGETMFRLKDRKGAAMALGVTHEEVFTSILRDAISSYRQLPQIWYQFQTKFRDEPRPKSGLLRVREFTMKDSYSFDVDASGLDRAFDAHHAAYCRIYERCGVAFIAVEASSGAMGGSQSTEFMVRTDAGEDTIIKCTSCAYSANAEKATSRIEAIDDGATEDKLERFATPDVRTIEALVNFPGGAAANKQIKTLIYACETDTDSATGLRAAPAKLIAALLRGDHELNLTKLSDTTGVAALRPGTEQEIFAALGAHPGSLGAVDLKAGDNEKIWMIVADDALSGRKNMTTGANQDDFHLRGVSIQRDMKIDRFTDLRTVKAGEVCVKCGSPLESFNGLEIGHIFKLGTRYSESMNAKVLTADGKATPVIMGSYGIGVERLMAAIVELSNDADGIIWPSVVAPYLVVVTPTNSSDQIIVDTAEKIYKELIESGIEAIIDDRDERPGVKFKDADLIGIPYRITVGRRASEGIVELVRRRDKHKEDVPLASCLAKLKEQ